MPNEIYHSFSDRKRSGKKSFAVLIDPDKVNDQTVAELIELSVSLK